MKHLDEIMRDLNRWLLAFAIGLAALDLTVACVLEATMLTRGLTPATGTLERAAPMATAPPVKIPPGVGG